MWFIVLLSFFLLGLVRQLLMKKEKMRNTKPHCLREHCFNTRLNVYTEVGMATWREIQALDSFDAD